MIRSKSVWDYTPINIPYNFNDSSIPIAIKIKNTDTEPSVKSMGQTQKPKVIKVDTNDSDVSHLFALEQLRNTQTKLFEYKPSETCVSKNKNFLHAKVLNDNFILSKLSKQKMYYKSIQSKMVSPTAKKKPLKSRRGSMGDLPVNYSNYIIPSKSDFAMDSTKNSNPSIENSST